jgi:hypothetical protein
MKTFYAVAIYLIGGFLTNAYCQVYRWDDWAQRVQKSEVYPYLVTNDDAAEGKLMSATIVWPAYWAARAALCVVSLEVNVRSVSQ